MKKLIIGLTGPVASGKGTVKKYIEEKYGAKDCRFSTILRDVLVRIDVPIIRENLQKVSTTLRQLFGEDLLARVIAKDVLELNSEIVVVDGVSRLADIRYLKENKGFVLISIDADPQVRYERMVLRNENVGDDKKTFEQFLADHNAEADSEVPIVMKEARFTIENSGTLDELKIQVDKLIGEIRK